MHEDRLPEIERLLHVAEDDLSRLEKQQELLVAQIGSLKREKENLQIPVIAEPPARYVNASVTNHSSEQEKIRLFRNLFRGREDVYARRFESRKTGKSGYQPECRNEWIAGLCRKPAVKCGRCDHRHLIPVSDAVIRNHLMGSDLAGKDFTIGVYPMLLDETCWFLAADFDKSTWSEDAQAFRETCELHAVPCCIERSRSGNGGHIWIFFSEAVPARLARSLGSLLLTETTERRPEIDLKSYDRFLPNQDTLPRGGFGNLIALPLQRKPRAKGNSVFLDGKLEPHPDQWAFLSSVKKLSRQDTEWLVQELSRTRQELGSHSAFAETAKEVPWETKRFTEWKAAAVSGPLPDKLNLHVVNQVYIPKQGLPPTMRNRIIRLAAFPNPEFYRAQAMRLSTYGKPRIITCAQEFSEYIAIPRGCLEELLDLLKSLNIATEILDGRIEGVRLETEFHGLLNDLQAVAAQTLVEHETGVLVAPTAFGKTVIGAWLIARRQANTLVLVHTRQLMDQWIRRLEEFLQPPPGTIGQIGAGKKRPTGLLDVAILQSLIHRDDVSDAVERYGHVIFDECHHISARNFELVARAAKARYITGFSATVERRDGHHPIIFMQCGPVRHRVTVEKQQANDQLTRTVLVRATDFFLPDALARLNSLTIHDVYECLIHDEQRNQLIIADTLLCLQKGRWPLILTERREHLKYLAESLASAVPNLVVLTGGMTQKQRQTKIADLQQSAPRVVLATGRYLGEGFDDQRLDTLLLALPISWRGTLAQYAGRLNRTCPGKHEVEIYDYADLEVPMLKRMFQKRSGGYKRLGYTMHE
jgi:superfamily II DNA or RNA helicase